MAYAGPDPSLASLSPGFFEAAKNSNLTPQELRVANALGGAYAKAKQFRAMSPVDAKKAYDALHPDAQLQLKAIDPNAKWAQAATNQSLGRKILNTVMWVPKTGFKIAASPLMGVWHTVEKYGKDVRMVGSVAEQALVNKADVFSKKTWNDAYNGVNQWNNSEIAKLEEQYGKGIVAVAKGNNEGLTPSQIIDKWGKADPEIMTAITQSLENKDSYKQIKQEVRNHSLNPGNLAMNAIASVQPKSGSLIDRYVNWANATVAGTSNWRTDPKAQKTLAKVAQKGRDVTSGSINAIFQVAIDPLTYVSGGSGEALTKGERLVQQLQSNMNKGMSSEMAVEYLFNSDAEISNFWNNRLGPLIAEFQKGDSANQAVTLLKIKDVAPAYDKLEHVLLLAEGEVVNAEMAKSYFGQIKNLPLLLGGAVDNVNFYRNGIATARDARLVESGKFAYLKDLFGGGVGEGQLYQTIDDITSKGTPIMDALKTAGGEIEQGVNPNLPKIDEIYKDISSAKKTALKIGELLERNPGGGQILFNHEAVKTAENFRLHARLAGFDRPMSSFLMMQYLDSPQEDRIVILRNLYYMIMQRFGLDGNVAGRELMKTILDKTFSNHGAFTTTVRTEVSKEFSNVTSKHAINWENEQAVLKSRGAVQPSQITPGIAPIPMEEIYNAAAMSRLDKYNLQKNGKDVFKNVSWRTPLELTDGLTRNNFVRKLTDVWSFGTIASRLGIRSAIDELFFYMMTAPTRDLIKFANKGGRDAGNVLTAYTGSMGSVGFMEGKINKWFRKGGPEGSISAADRKQIVEDIRAAMEEKTGLPVPIEAVRNWQIQNETANRAIQLWSNDMSFKEINYLKDLMVHNPNFIDSMASSVGARTSMSGQIDKEFIDSTFTPSALTMAEKELEIKVGKTYRPMDEAMKKRIGEKYEALAHYDNSWIRFASNERALDHGNYINPVAPFFINKALQTPKDFENAVFMIMQNVGFKLEKSVDKAGFEMEHWVPKNEKSEDSIANFNGMFGNTVIDRQNKLTEAEIAQGHIETMLHDMRNTFHGNAKGYNGELYDAVVNNWKDLTELERVTGKKISQKWEKSFGSIEFPDFEKLTQGKHPIGETNTRLEFDDFGDTEGMWKTLGNKVYEVADRQVNALYRQPATLVTYVRLRKANASAEAQFVEEQYRMHLDNMEFKSEKAKEIAWDIASKDGAKRYSQIAADTAVNTVLKYSDNPAVRSNLSLSLRAASRFYRSTEDFYRRLYRLAKERPLQVIYRMRLMQLGMDGSGMWHKDANGNPYLIIPTDAIINNLVEPTMRTLMGVNDHYKIPQFNEFTMKLNLFNPSFSTDAGQPTLSGPAMALSLLGARALAGHSPFFRPEMEQFTNTIDTLALGPSGNQLSLTSAMIPIQLQNIWAALPLDERSRQETTAQVQAVTYLEAHNKGLPANATKEQRNDYLKAVRVAAHNIIALRAIFGIFSPFMPTSTEGKDLPGYYKDAGLPSLRSAFYDIKKGIDSNLGPEVLDPYELALSTFIGKNPKKIVYTLSRSDRNTRVIIDKTTDTKNWIINNKGLIDKYGEAAYIFSPHTNAYNPTVYTWLQGQDLINVPTLETYLDRVRVAEDKATYFAIGHNEADSLNNTSSVEQRQKIINEATYQRKILLSSNPLLLAAINTGSAIGDETDMLSTMKEILDDPNAPLHQDQRVKMKVLNQKVTEYLTFAKDPDNANLQNFSEAKRQAKDEINQLISTMKNDPIVSEAYRAVYKGILDYYSRDSYSAFRR